MSNIGAELRKRGFVPLPRLWVPGQVANMIIRHAEQWAAEVNEIRATARNASAHDGQIGTADAGRNAASETGVFRGGNTAPHAPGADQDPRHGPITSGALPQKQRQRSKDDE